MPRPRLPRRKVVEHGRPEQVATDGATYRFAVDVLTCGHRIYWDRDRPATRGCWDCAEGRPAGFHDQPLGVHQP